MKSTKTFILFQVFSKNISKKLEAIIEPVHLEEEYFHDFHHNYSVLLRELQILPSAPMEVRRARTTLADRKVDLEVTVPSLEMTGLYSVQDMMQATKLVVPTTGRFRLQLYNVTGMGLAVLSSHPTTNNTVHLAAVDIKYDTSAWFMRVTEHGLNRNISDFIHNEEFGDSVKQKLWPELTRLLNDALEREANFLLGQQPIPVQMRDGRNSQKLEKQTSDSNRNVDGIVDSIISSAKSVIMQRLDNKIRLPDIAETFSALLFRGSFKARDGYASNLATLYRSGETSLTSDNDFLHLYGNLGFQNLQSFSHLPIVGGAVVAERLACSPPTNASRVQSPTGSLPDFRKCESCRMMPLVGQVFFNGISRFPRSCIPAPRSILTSLHSHRALNTSSLRAAQISQLTSTPIVHCTEKSAISASLSQEQCSTD
ncbi:hypothetical protein PR048_027181 [Dryococelus australis]|uniref:Uncharacterized protein n=1 Tax=Dryococelus australis TaxID=614101 RepID=A0ABQ9GEQ1_9NEOP|nr:hypothetical protein PR048_027181 [Dryococelus australis]